MSIRAAFAPFAAPRAAWRTGGLGPQEGARGNKDKGLRRAGVSAKGVADGGGLADLLPRGPGPGSGPETGLLSRL